MSYQAWEMVVNEMKRLNDDLKTIHVDLKEMNQSLENIKIEIAQLKIKSGLWGGIAGVLPTVVYFIYKFVKGGSL